MFHRRICLAVLVMLGIDATFRHAVVAQEPPQKAVVRLVVDYGDGVEKHFTAIPWRENMTVLDVMKAARAHPHGIKFETKGSAGNTLLTRIDDVANEGRGRNWLFRVNDKLGDRSFAIFKLDVWDTVLWKFDTYR